MSYELGNNIKRIREKRGISQEVLGYKLGVSGKTVSSWENGRTEPNMGKLQEIATALKVKISELVYSEEFENITDILLDNIIQIPLYSSISCGLGLFVDDHIEDYVSVPVKYTQRNKDYFANTAKGDSMIGKGIKDNDVLVFEKTDYIDNGQIGAFCLDNGEALCKIFRKLSNGIILLESANANYDPIEVDITKDCFRVIGVYKFKFSVEQ